jgi:hypothetical protein
MLFTSSSARCTARKNPLPNGLRWLSPVILTSQLPVSRWHEQIGDPTIAEASSTAWCTMPIASRCAESLSARNAIPPRGMKAMRRRDEL